ncbi:MAG: hypothetical protein D6689_06665 [Deltaproteobacteria bacterium]|nr:MAG: hypothetical protein D6689_06665 [Deltaproteobacteria bacterium]
MDARVRTLRDRAQQAVDRGKYAKALEAYRELEEIDPGEGDWPRRAAECHRRLGDRDGAVAALLRGADRYARAGFIVKAVALCKRVLALAPDHPDALHALAEYSAARGIPYAPRQAAAEPPAERPRTLPPGGALEDVDLARVVPDAAPVRPVAEDDSGIYVIPLDDADLIEVAAADDAARAAARDALPRTPLFSDLSPDLLSALVDRCELVELDARDVVFRQGDVADALYVVADGAVAVFAEGPPRVQLDALGEGAFFGEIGLLTRTPRRATVECTEDRTALLRIGVDAIGDLIDREPRVLRVLLRFVRDRLIDALVKTSPLFAPFAGPQRAELAARFRFVEIERGAVLVEQGARADGLYVLLAGRAEVVRDGGDGPHRLATLEAGDLCGEMSLLAREPAVATVRATTKCFALAMPAEAFREVIMTHPQVLAFVGDLADQRRRANAAIAGGSGDYAEGRVELV